VAGAAALVGGLVVAYFSFSALFLAMCLFDTTAFAVAWSARRT
jgi:hypothetical protein